MSNPVEEINTIVIVGGGDIGLITALLLKRTNRNTNITVIDDFSEPVPAVGKSTFDSIVPVLHQTLDIDETRFIQEVQPVWKSSVYFKDWCGVDEFHFPFDDPYITSNRKDLFDEAYYRYQETNYRTINCEMAEQAKTPYHHTKNGIGKYPAFAYHLDLSKFNPFLRTVCKERGINLQNDRVTSITTDHSTRIKQLTGRETSYTADLFVDATGFKRTLISELNPTFQPYPVPLDSAVVAQRPLNLDEITPSTVITTGDNGWFWQIDTTTHRDIGYVYSSTHCSKADAVSEFLNEFSDEPGIQREEIREYSFDSGAIETPWIGNCLAVGNAESFIEPLQSTALTHSVILARSATKLLAHNRYYNSQGVRNTFNNHAQTLWDRVKEFISLHYAFAPGNTPFWHDIRDLINPSDKPWYTQYQTNGIALSIGDKPIEDFTTYAGLPPSSFRLMIQQLGVNSKFYETISPEVPHHIKQDVHDHRKYVFDEVKDQYLSYPEYYGSTSTRHTK